MFKYATLIVLIGIAQATNLQEESSVIATLQIMEQSSFGRYILDTIMVEMETGDSLDRLMSTLSKLEDRYVADQKEDDARNTQFQGVCDADIATYDKNIKDASYEKMRFEGKLEGDLYPNRAVLQGVEKAKLREVKEYTQELNELDKERQEESEIYEVKMEEHRLASRIIREAKALFVDNLQKPTLVELKKNKNTPNKLNPQAIGMIQLHLTTSIKEIKATHKYTKSYASLFNVLLTIASKAQATADQGSIGKIIQLCADLLDKIDNSSDLERFAEDKRIQAWQKHRALITRDLNSASSILANTQASIQSLTDQIDQILLSIENIDMRLDNMNDMRHERYVECEQDAYDYSQRRSKRDADRQIVSDVIGLVNQHARVLREQMALRVAAGENLD